MLMKGYPTAAPLKSCEEVPQGRSEDTSYNRVRCCPSILDSPITQYPIICSTSDVRATPLWMNYRPFLLRRRQRSAPVCELVMDRTRRPTTVHQRRKGRHWLRVDRRIVESVSCRIV